MDTKIRVLKNPVSYRIVSYRIVSYRIVSYLRIPEVPYPYRISVSKRETFLGSPLKSTWGIFS
jgi:hypothetical protein